MTTKLHVHNWEKWQTYRTDRPPPPWIKIHRQAMLDPKWAALSDAQKGQLVCIWMLAAADNGVVPNDANFIRKVCALDVEPDLNIFQELGFLDAKVTAQRRRRNVKRMSPRPANDAPEKRREEENKIEESRDSGADAPDPLPLEKGNGLAKGEVQKAFENYNRMAEHLGLPKAQDLTEDRKRKLAARLKEIGLIRWNSALDNLADMPFCTGKNDRGWKVNFDWLLSPANLNKILDRAYERTETLL